MKTITIGKKISLACMALVGLTMILGTVAVLNIRRINHELEAIVKGPLPGIYSIGRISGLTKEQKVSMLEHIASESPERMIRLESQIAGLESKFQEEMKRYEKTIRTGLGRELFDNIQPRQERFNSIWAKIQILSRARKTKEALGLWNTEAVPAEQERTKALDEILEYRKTSGDANAAAASEAGIDAGLWSLSILVFAFISGSLLAYFIVRGINKVLAQTIAELSAGALQVSSAAGQVSVYGQSLAQGSSDQASSLEETSASSEEMASMTSKNAENSQQAAQFMKVVSRQVVEANGTLGEMMTSMREIGASSGEISKIIKVIDEIAFQTNILALNAAVEAARAGEAGMGFAVVADEVRNLAQRSAQAAKDTAALIENSILKSDEGSKKLGEVAESIQAITKGAGKVKTLIDEVEASSKEQAQGIEQISKAVTQMEAVTQRTATNAEQSAAASDELNAQSKALMAVIHRLEVLIGAHPGNDPGSPEVKSGATTRPLKKRSSQNGRPTGGRSNPAPQPAPDLSAHRAVEFPLDERDFREF